MEIHDKQRLDEGRNTCSARSIKWDLSAPNRGVLVLPQPAAVQDANPVGLFTLADPEHLGAACRANTLGCGSSIFHCYFLRVFHFSFGFTFYAISFHLFTSSKLFI
jgi:hypothetical protein